MNQSAEFPPSDLDQWAERQLADYDAIRPGTLFAEGTKMDLSTGYMLQDAVTALRVGRGENVIGYKVGCTSPAIRKQLGIDHCISGHLYDTERHESGVKLSSGRYANLAIEGELAVLLSEDPSEFDPQQDPVPSWIGRIFPVIELHHHVMRGEQASAAELVANNAIHAGFIAGCGVEASALRTPRSLEALSLVIEVDGRPIARCAGAPLIRTIGSSLYWLIESLRERGQGLEAGQTVLTGSVPSLIPITDSCRVRVDARRCGDVEASFSI